MNNRAYKTLKLEQMLLKTFVVFIIHTLMFVKTKAKQRKVTHL